MTSDTLSSNGGERNYRSPFISCVTAVGFFGSSPTPVYRAPYCASHLSILFTYKFASASVSLSHTDSLTRTHTTTTTTTTAPHSQVRILPLPKFLFLSFLPHPLPCPAPPLPRRYLRPHSSPSRPVPLFLNFYFFPAHSLFYTLIFLLLFPFGKRERCKERKSFKMKFCAPKSRNKTKEAANNFKPV